MVSLLCLDCCFVLQALTVDNFPHLREKIAKGYCGVIDSSEPFSTSSVSSSPEMDQEDSRQSEQDIETGMTTATTTTTTTTTTTPIASASASPTMEEERRNQQPLQLEDPKTIEPIEEDQLFVEIPSPGFKFASSTAVVGQGTNRQVPNLCRYVPGRPIDTFISFRILRRVSKWFIPLSVSLRT